MKSKLVVLLVAVVVLGRARGGDAYGGSAAQFMLESWRPQWYQFFTYQFLHANWQHLLGNMLFLFVFGRSIEDRFGHLKFLAIYFLAGLGGNLLHILLNPASRVPTIGASGAIAGILGTYFVTFPAARITTLIPLFFLFWTVELPALLLLGYWFLIQFFTGFQMLAIQSATGGVAWWGHVGGFLVGLLLALVFQPRSRRRIIEVP